MIPSFNDHPSRENIDRKVFQKSKKKKKKKQEWKVAVGSMESWISIPVEFSKGNFNLHRIFRGMNSGPGQFSADKGRSPIETVVVTQWEERLEAYFWLVRYQWPALLHHSPYLLYFYVGQPTRGQIVIFLFPPRPTFFNANPARD